jgi:lysyl-tRNA synthetase class 2
MGTAMTGGTRFWAPDRHADRRPFLVGRNRINVALRQWFAARDFVEVETAALQVSPGNETHLHGFASEQVTPGGERMRRYLRTSPEFACKKLLAAGERRIVEFARSFRNRERGSLHAPEFTMLEWYRTGEPYDVLMDDCAALVAVAAETVNTKAFSWRGVSADPFARPERVPVAEAFSRYAGIDRLQLMERDRLALAARGAGVEIAANDTWGDIFSRVLVERVEPHLGAGRATVLYEYPAVMSALARPKASDPRVAERFELYVCGIELANGCAELGDPAAQRRNLEAQMAEKQRIYGERYPIEEDFLAALAQMPPACGVALGLDRLVMLATGATHIDQVQWTPAVDR